jgi:hypothetical protein
MKKLLLIIMIIYFIGFVFFKSNTIESRQWKERIEGIEYDRTSYSLNWENLPKYLKNLYKGLVTRFKGR